LIAARSCFLLHLVPDPRARLSFPPRRSSDLAKGVGRNAGAGPARAPPPRSLARSGGERDGRAVDQQPALAGVDPHGVAVADPPLDRKSTRLNSSHVKNSYAALCSKKKSFHW